MPLLLRQRVQPRKRQQLSVGSQESEARKIAKREWLEIIEVFRETKSAKEPWRPKFNEMMSYFTKKKADCIIKEQQEITVSKEDLDDQDDWKNSTGIKIKP